MFDDNDNNQPKFIISGMNENIDISPDLTKENMPRMASLGNGENDEPMIQAGEHAVNEITNVFGITEEELETAMNSFTKVLMDGTDSNFLKKIEPHITLEDGGFHLDTDGTKMILDKFLGGNHVADLTKSSMNTSNPSELQKFMHDNINILNEKGDDVIRNFLKEMFDSIGLSEEQIEEMINSLQESEQEEVDPFTEPDKKITSYDFDIIGTNESFGVIKHIITANIHEEFKDIYGEGPYALSTFIATKGYNIIPAFLTMDTLEFIGYSSKYILFIAKSNDDDVEEFVVAAVKTGDGIFDFIVPEFGNSYNIETGEAISKTLNVDMYNELEDKQGNITLELKYPIDLDRIKGGLDLLLYEEKTPLLALKDFGKVFEAPVPSIMTSDFVRIGRIRSYKSEEVNTFKMQCDLDEDMEFFDFYIQLGEQYPARTIDAIRKYLERIDFDNNPKICNSEVYAKNYNSVYIKLDLGYLEGFARHWVEY